MLKILSRRTFALWALPLALALNVASCRTRNSKDTSSRLRATTAKVPSYGDDFEVYYHWGDKPFLDRLTSNHIPNHIYPGEEKAYGYYSDKFYAEVMKYSDNGKNSKGPGIYVARDPISSSFYGVRAENPKLIEVIIDKRVTAENTVVQLGNYPQYVVKKNKGIYFREFSGAGFSVEEIVDLNFILREELGASREYFNPNLKVLTYFSDLVGTIVADPPTDKVRLLPPREWVCPQG